MLRSTNPTLNDQTFVSYHGQASSDSMSLEGTMIKAGPLGAVTMIVTMWTWQASIGNGMVTAERAALPWFIGGLVIGGGAVFATLRNQEWARVTAIVFAIAEGLILGGLAAFTNMRFPGVAFQVFCMTVGTLAAMLIIFWTGLLESSEQLKLWIISAVGGIFVAYFLAYVFNLFGAHDAKYLHQLHWTEIVLSLIVAAGGALSHILTFEVVEQGVSRGAPKHMEWYTAFGLLVALVWLYIEAVPLLIKARELK